MKKLIFIAAFLLGLQPYNLAAAQKKPAGNQEEIIHPEIKDDGNINDDLKATDEDLKFLKDSDDCYDSAEKTTNKDKAAKSASEDQRSEILDKYFNDCMKEKGHNMDEEVTPDGPNITGE